MLGNITIFLLQTIFGLLTFLLLLRFVMQWTRSSFQNPLGQMSIALTDFMVKPVRRFVKHYKQWDLSTLLLAFLMQLILAMLLSALGGYHLSSPVAIGISALLGLATSLINLFFYAILLLAILSWINPQSPVYGVLNQISAPVLRPLRNIVPSIQGFDLSAMAALILLQLCEHIILPGLIGAWL